MIDFIEVLQQQMALIDIAEDLKTNADDANHIRAGGIIAYILDENVFEFFMSPALSRNSRLGFYSRPWRRKENESENALYESLDAQTAMLTAEWIISGKLPGSDSTRLLMSELHRRELSGRIQAINNTLSNEIDTLVDVAFRQRRKLLNNLIHGKPADQFSLQTAEFTDQRLMSEDISFLRKNGVDNDLLNLMRRNRECASVLADGHLLERIIQLKRVASKFIFGRTVSAENVYELSKQEIAEVTTEAEKWTLRISEELQLPGNRDRIRARKQSLIGSEDSDAELNYVGSIWNDAWSIALVQKVADSNRSKNVKNVFVTGDQLLVDTYRRWYFSEARDSDYPYVLRRFGQYAPHFNPNDTGSVFSNVRATRDLQNSLFDSVQRAMETSVVPWLGALSGIPHLHQNALTRRETVSLIEVTFPDIFTGHELRSAVQRASADPAKLVDEWKAIASKWQEVQRISVGAASLLIASRLEMHGEVLENLTGTQDPSSLQLYVEGLLNEVSYDSLKLWIPGAIDIASKSRDILKANRHHPAISFEDFRVPLSEDGEKQEAIFAAAAINCFANRDYTEAMRYADLSMRADESARRLHKAMPNFQEEVYFLNAVTLRYGIAIQSRHFHIEDSTVASANKARQSFEKVRDRFERARHFLDWILILYSSQLYDEPDAENQLPRKVRYARAVSELAALNLFYATTTGLSALTDDRYFSESKFAEEASRRCQDAIDRLAEAASLVWEIHKGRQRLRENERTIYELVNMQASINRVSVVVLRYLLEFDRENPFSESPQRTLRLARTIAKEHKLDHPVALAEFSAYAKLFGIRDLSASNHIDLTLLLPLDRILIREISSKVLRAPLL